MTQLVYTSAKAYCLNPWWKLDLTIALNIAYTPVIQNTGGILYNNTLITVSVCIFFESRFIGVMDTIRRMWHVNIEVIDGNCNLMGVFLWNLNLQRRLEHMLYLSNSLLKIVCMMFWLGKSNSVYGLFTISRCCVPLYLFSLLLLKNKLVAAWLHWHFISGWSRLVV